MQFTSLSVRNLLILTTTLILFSFRNDLPSASMLEGKWDCGSKSGQLGENVSYQVHCAGDVAFHADRTISSTCTDAFFPSGAKWQVEDKKLVLRDSYGAAFVEFDIKVLETNKLVLIRKNVEYGFIRSK